MALVDKKSVDNLLLNRSLILVSGKGGVGKTAISSALAFRAKELGRPVLLFCCDAPSELKPFSNGKILNAEVREILPSLWGVNQKTEEAVYAYLVDALRSKKLVDVMFRNKVARAFLQVAPSVGDLAMMGRIFQLAQSFSKKHQGVLIVDMPATGHALAMLKSPEAIANILVAGPVYDRAREIVDFFKDQSKTTFLPVTWPEELPITEVIELIEGVLQTGVDVGPVLLNGVVSNPIPSLPENVWSQMRELGALAEHQKWVDYLRVWAQRVNRERNRLLVALNDRLPDENALMDFPFLSRIPPTSSLGAELANALSG